MAEAENTEEEEGKGPVALPPAVPSIQERPPMPAEDSFGRPIFIPRAVSVPLAAHVVVVAPNPAPTPNPAPAPTPNPAPAPTPAVPAPTQKKSKNSPVSIATMILVAFISLCIGIYVGVSPVSRASSSPTTPEQNVPTDYSNESSQTKAPSKTFLSPSPASLSPSFLPSSKSALPTTAPNPTTEKKKDPLPPTGSPSTNSPSPPPFLTASTNSPSPPPFLNHASASTPEWVPVKPEIIGSIPSGQFGNSMAMSPDGRRIIATSIQSFASFFENGPIPSGPVRVYEWISTNNIFEDDSKVYTNSSMTVTTGGGNWMQLGTDIIPGGEDTACTSSSSLDAKTAVAISDQGNRIAISCPHNDANSPLADGKSLWYAGRVFTYEYNSRLDAWDLLAVPVPGDAANDHFGHSLALSANGTILAAGSYHHGADTGHVRIFRLSEDTTMWLPLGQDIRGECRGDRSAYSIALSSNGFRIVIGSVHNDDQSLNSGQVRVYEYDDNSRQTWMQLGSDINGDELHDWLGYSVTISADGTTIAAGTFTTESSSQQEEHTSLTLIYEYDTTQDEWIPKGQNSIVAKHPNELKASSISLSQNGNHIALASYQDQTSSGEGTGFARIYELKWKNETHQWVQVGQDLYGGPRDYSGHTISLSRNGKRVALAVPEISISSDEPGRVKVFDTDDVSFPTN